MSPRRKKNIHTQKKQRMDEIVWSNDMNTDESEYMTSDWSNDMNTDEYGTSNDNKVSYDGSKRSKFGTMGTMMRKRIQKVSLIETRSRMQMKARPGQGLRDNPLMTLTGAQGTVKGHHVINRMNIDMEEYLGIFCHGAEITLNVGGEPKVVYNTLPRNVTVITMTLPRNLLWVSYQGQVLDLIEDDDGSGKIKRLFKGNIGKFNELKRELESSFSECLTNVQINRYEPGKLCPELMLSMSQYGDKMEQGKNLVTAGDIKDYEAINKVKHWLKKRVLSSADTSIMDNPLTSMIIKRNANELGRYKVDKYNLDQRMDADLIVLYVANMYMDIGVETCTGKAMQYVSNLDLFYLRKLSHAIFEVHREVQDSAGSSNIIRVIQEARLRVAMRIKDGSFLNNHSNLTNSGTSNMQSDSHLMQRFFAEIKHRNLRNKSVKEIDAFVMSIYAALTIGPMEVRKAHSDRALMKQYNHTSFFLSTFIKEQCKDPRTKYYIYVMSCRELASFKRTLGVPKPPGIVFQPVSHEEESPSQQNLAMMINNQRHKDQHSLQRQIMRRIQQRIKLKHKILH